MTPWEMAAVLAAGVAGGAINTVVGSGSLITFPTLLAVGLPPITANVSNNIGLVSGGFTGVMGYRPELKGQRERLLKLAPASAIGSLIGGFLLLNLPESSFNLIVSVLIAISCTLVLIQPRLSRLLNAPELNPASSSGAHGGPWLWLGTLAAGMFGGYFGAGQGILLLGVMGILLADDLQRLNAAKNVLVLLVNSVAAVLYAVVADVDWLAVLLVALGSMAGGFLGARVGRRLPQPVLRGVIVCIGVVAIVKLLTD
ncbi:MULTISPECIES: sulfite exporter TauE/SafE family protein [unclassified Nonomuraea]|uniref:sulfite exporter TauE/SafE family protein n=1 Tax=unclassified Nonomuraea TaxID=2593643 RepID=UPI00273A7CFE|nr:sulfite exporter TauE/SafE family protein [Nonomuraea sp. G32]MDP4510764.1 sulfite exporter TauE/SafE family protein [Nonomuraea sp. G32]